MSTMSTNAKDVIIWAHSDQKGGAEIAYLLAFSLQSAARDVRNGTPEIARDLSIAIAAPQECLPENVWTRTDTLPRASSSDAVVW
jgi:hypothetical protein